MEGNHYIGGVFPAFLLEQLQNVGGINLNQIGESNFKDLLGRPFFMSLSLSIEGETFRLPNEPLISFSRSKNIVKTELVGSKHRGTVKEFIGLGDYEISIVGLCHNENGYPTDQVEMIKKLDDYVGSLEIENEILNFFDIRQIVIESTEFTEMQGQENSQVYRMRAMSDDDFFGDLINRDLINVLQ